MAERTRWGITQIAAELGFGVQAVKKWRGHTIKALTAAGKLDDPEANIPLPTNALPIPSNQREHVKNGDHPRWEPDVILRWAETTSRRDPDTKATVRPSPPGPPPNPTRPPGARNRALTAAA